MENLLRVEHMSISFIQYQSGVSRQRLNAVRDLSLAVDAGQVVAVVGASGSGKSLLAHGILHLLPYNAAMEGTLLYRGEPLTPKRAENLRGSEIVLVPQGVTYLDPLMKVGEQIRKGKKEAKSFQRCREVLSRYDLNIRTERLYPFELSGGMARRVLISTAVVEFPRLIIADEPTPGLDTRAAGRILSHFRQLADEGAGVLLITHELESALSIADRVVVLYAGETVEEAAPCDFTSKHLRHPYTKALWNAMPQNGFLPIPGAQPRASEITEGCLFAPRCSRCLPECTAGVIPYLSAGSGRVRCLRWKEGGVQ